MAFSFRATTLARRERLSGFMRDHIWPLDADFHSIVHKGHYLESLIDGLKAKAKAAGLWSLFLPGLEPDASGTRLSNLD